MICTYINDLHRYKTVSDPQVAELFREVRMIDDRFYIEDAVIKGRWFWQRPITLYSIYIHRIRNEVHVYNFHHDSIYPFVAVPKEIIMNWMLGFMNTKNNNKKIELNKLVYDAIVKSDLIEFDSDQERVDFGLDIINQINKIIK